VLRCRQRHRIAAEGVELDACRPVLVGAYCFHGRQQDGSENYAELRRAYRSLFTRQNDPSDQELNVVDDYA
jgi:hypothetical protein